MKKILTKREVQLAELDMLKKFIEVCDKYKLTYWLYAGTALGAARHKGFIPWDDDIDLIMPRSDYDKMMRLCREKDIFSSYGLSIEIPEILEKPLYPFAKLYNKNIVLEADNIIDSRYLWLDIFQLDGLGDDISENYLKMSRLVKNFQRKLRLEFSLKSKEELSITKKIKRFFARIVYFFISRKKLINKIEKETKRYSYDDSEYLNINTWSTNEKDALKKEWVQKTVKVQFENIKANVFNGYKDYLENRYGKKYMELPPKSMQVTHSFKAWKVDEEENHSN